MERPVDSNNNSDIGDSNSIYLCSTSSSSFTESDSEANEAGENITDQLPQKRVRRRGRLAF